MPVCLDGREVDVLLRASVGVSRDEIVELCNRVTTAGRDSKDSVIVSNMNGSFDALVTLCRSITNSQKNELGILFFSLFPRNFSQECDRIHFVAVLRYVVETLKSWPHVVETYPGKFCRVWINLKCGLIDGHLKDKVVPTLLHGILI